jgi:4-amino-4-deoxy-L-arabinose transferase-like glycosyltransferase
MAKLANNDGAGAASLSRSGIASDAAASSATGGLSARAVGYDSASVPISRHEFITIVLVMLVGVGLRVAFPSRMAVEHFDEGVYASNIFFDAEQGYRFPNQHLYAPPLLPWLIEWVFILFGPSNVGAMVPSLVAGCLTVPLLWWVGRRWFGPTAGLAASILCATNDIHILFSRSALTDVLLCFWLLLAVYLFWEAITRDHLGWAIAAGVATSLAWWTKYTGWLPLAITSAGLALSWLLDRRTRAGWKRHAACWLITAGVAALLWSPWLWSLQPHGGYKAVHDNHRGYVVGWGGWWESLRTQITNLRELDGALTWVGVAAAIMFVVAGRTTGEGRFTWNPPTWSQKLAPVPWIIFGCPVGWLVRGGPILAFTLSVLAGVWVVIRGVQRMTSVGLSELPVSGAAIIAVSVWALWFVTPLYSPFPRLMLPLIGFTWLAAALLTGMTYSFASRLDAASPRLAKQSLQWLATTISLAVTIAVLAEDYSVPSRDGLPAGFLRVTPEGWGTRESLHRLALGTIADSMKASAKTSEGDRVFYVYGEPALYFQLRLAGVELVGPVEHLAFGRKGIFPLAKEGAPAARVPVFLVTGPHAERNPNFARQFDEVKDRLKLVQEYEYQPSDLVWRDQRREFDAPPKFHVKLYRVE